MRKPLIAGNWKMNGTRSSVAGLVAAVVAGADNIARAEILLCPSDVFLSQVAEALRGSTVLLGGQNLSDQTNGAFTGEVSGAMLVEAGCSHVIVGHSERRARHGETDAVVAAKYIAAQTAGLIPVLCVGETLDERRSGVTQQVIVRQMSAVIDAAGVDSLGVAVVAYEPVWAIGTGETASPEQAQEVHGVLRALVASRSARIAAGLRILYGGSVKASNAAEIFAMDDIDGGLIGGASLQADEFLRICHLAAKQT